MKSPQIISHAVIVVLSALCLPSTSLALGEVKEALNRDAPTAALKAIPGLKEKLDQKAPFDINPLRPSASIQSLDTSGKLAKQPNESPATLTASSPLRDLPLVIQSMMTKGKDVRFVDQFDAGSGMTGFVLSAGNGEQRIFYVTPDKKKAILGLVYDERLINLTAQHQRDHMDLTPHLPLEGHPVRNSLLDIAMLMRPLATEEAPSPSGQLDVFIFTGLDSHEFKTIYKQTRPYLSSLRIHWMPIVNITPAGQIAQTALLSFLKTKDKLVFLSDQASLPPQVSVLTANTKVPSDSAKDKKIEFIEETHSPQAKYREMGVSSADVPSPFVVYEGMDRVTHVIQGVPSTTQWEALVNSLKSKSSPVKSSQIGKKP